MSVFQNPHPRSPVPFLLALSLLVSLGGCGGGGGGSGTTPIPPVTQGFSLTVSTNGNGAVTSDPTGIACGSSCNAAFSPGGSVTLEAVPATGFLFRGWVGACSGSSPACTLTMNQNQTVLAQFVAEAAPPAKPPLIGLVTMGDMDWSFNPSLEPENRLLEARAHPGVYTAAVIQATWSELEPEPGVFDDGAIDDALQNIEAYNAEYPATPLVGKLRVFPGVHTPSWVMQEVGSVQLINMQSGNPITVPDYWKPLYSVLWTQLQDHLASVYDGNPLIGEVAVTSCSSFSGEPFNNGQGSFANASALVAGGYTDAQYEQCLTNAATNYAAWTRTPIDFPFNTLLLMQSQEADPDFTIQVMQQFRETYGTRAVVANEDLNDPLGPSLEPVYDEFLTLYADAQATTPPTLSPLEFQTVGPLVDWSTVVPFGIDTYHPTEIEVWNSTATGAPGGYADITQAELEQWSAEIKDDQATGSQTP